MLVPHVKTGKAHEALKSWGAQKWCGAIPADNLVALNLDP